MGLALTYTRDKAVAHFCRQQGIGWHEYQSNGVIRALKNRDTWSANWLQTVQAPQQHPDLTRWYPAPMLVDWYEDQRGPDLSSAWLVPAPPFQPGGENNGHRYMGSFLHERIALYAQSTSKPLESRRGCSCLSPYLAWGCLSIHQVYQAQQETAKNSSLAGLRQKLAAFASRLR